VALRKTLLPDPDNAGVGSVIKTGTRFRPSNNQLGDGYEHSRRKNKTRKTRDPHTQKP